MSEHLVGERAALARAIERAGIPERQVGLRLGKSQVWVANYLKGSPKELPRETAWMLGYMLGCDWRTLLPEDRVTWYDEDEAARLAYLTERRRELLDLPVTADSDISTQMRRDDLERGEAALRERVARLLGPKQVVSFEAVPPDGASVKEYAARAHAGAGAFNGDERVLAHWALPVGWVRQARGAAILEILGDSMAPTLLSGDKAVVDTGDKTPSPPGVFVVWDGLGVVAKRVQPVHGSDPLRLRLLSDNPAYSPYEAVADEAGILGRVIGVVRRL